MKVHAVMTGDRTQAIQLAFADSKPNRLLTLRALEMAPKP
jgi:hypothetical protein